MMYLIPTKRGFGVEIWGTFEDLDSFYGVIGKFWNDEQYMNQVGFEGRDKLISGFSYELRKAKEGRRMTRDSSHFSLEKNKYLGTKISWVHFLFSISAIRYNMRFYETNKLDISSMLLVDFWLEKAMNEYDEIGAKLLVGFIDGLNGANENIYQCMRSINLDYFLLGGGKRAFRKLSNLLCRGVYSTNSYNEYNQLLVKESKRLGCDVRDLDIEDDHIDYEKLRW